MMRSNSSLLKFYYVVALWRRYMLFDNSEKNYHISRHLIEVPVSLNPTSEIVLQPIISDLSK